MGNRKAGQKPFLNTFIPIEWDIESIKNLTIEHKQGYYTKESYSEGGKYHLIRGMDLHNPNVTWKDSPKVDASESDYDLYKVNIGDFLFVRSGNIGKYGIIKNQIPPSIFASYLIRFKFNKDKVTNYFLGTFYSSDYCINQLKKITQGSSNVNINASNIKDLKIPLPPLPEQRAIAQVLGTMDSVIHHHTQLIAQKELRKKWLMQHLLTGSKRLKGFKGDKLLQETKLGLLPVDWKLQTLKEVLIPAGKSLKPEKETLYQQIGIRSHTKGIFYKEKVTGKSLGNKRVFWIESDCFVVNIVFAWEHAIAKTTDKEVGMIASHRFPMYKPQNGVLDLDYLLYFFKSPRGKYLLGLASPGGAGRNKTLGKSEFLKLQIPIPSMEEQKAIAHILQTADTEIELLKGKTEKLREQKKGMMQVLLTGKKRLKLEE